MTLREPTTPCRLCQGDGRVNAWYFKNGNTTQMTNTVVCPACQGWGNEMAAADGELTATPKEE